MDLHDAPDTGRLRIQAGYLPRTIDATPQCAARVQFEALRVSSFLGVEISGRLGDGKGPLGFFCARLNHSDSLALYFQNSGKIMPRSCSTEGQDIFCRLGKQDASSPHTLQCVRAFRAMPRKIGIRTVLKAS